MAAPLHIIILAAGQGKRMGSQRPKVLQQVAARPLLAHVLEVARQLKPAGLHVVHGYGAEAVRAAFADSDDIDWVMQDPPQGTGHAVQLALPSVPRDARVLVLLGDTPLVTVESLSLLLQQASDAVAVLSADFVDPTGYGRIVRGDGGQFLSIVEHRDANPKQRRINEINSGVMAAPRQGLSRWLQQLSQDNSQGEFYLTDTVAIARDEGVAVAAIPSEDPDEVLGANDRWQLAQLERLYQLRQARALCLAGACLADPTRIDVRGELTVDEGVWIDVNAVFAGRNQLGREVSIGANCVLTDCRLGANTRVHPHCVLEGVETRGDCDIGPFARLRPGTCLAEGVRVGNFVETKQAVLAAGAKANHLSYLGDCDIGQQANIGAGTITCNYDGVNKFRTIIGDHAFIGSDTQLVAPVEVGAGATIGAGSTITRSAPADKLTLSRARQVTVDQWKKPRRRESD